MPEPLDSALRQFSEQACNILASRLPNGSLPRKSTDAWQRASDGNIVRQYVSKPDLSSLHEFEKELLSTPESETAVEALASHPAIGPCLGQLVGAANYAQRRIEAQDILRALLYRIADSDEPIYFDEQRFLAIWGSICHSLTADKYNFVCLAPLPGLTGLELPVQLSSSMEMDYLTDDEVVRCIDLGILRTMTMQGQYGMLLREDTVGLRLWWPVDRVINAPENKVKGTSRNDEFACRAPINFNQQVDDILALLRLVTDETVYCPGCIGFIDDSFIAGYGGQFHHRTTVTFQPRSKLTGENINSFKELLERIQKSYLSRHRQLEVAFRYFSYAHDRSRFADKMIDLMIAAEAMFLSDAGGELKFRLQMRASQFVDSMNFTPKEVFTLIGIAYDARSNIVHSGDISDSTKRRLKEKTLRDLYKDVMSIMRSALLKAMSYEDSKGSFGNSEFWENLLFPDSQT